MIGGLLELGDLGVSFFYEFHSKLTQLMLSVK